MTPPLMRPAAATITSLSNPRVRAAVRLRDRGTRDATGLTIVDGAREILRALRAGVALEEAFVCDEAARTEDARAAIAAVDRAGGQERPVWRVTPSVLGKVAYGERAEGLVAIVRQPSTRLADLLLSADPLLVVIEGLEKPGNLGAILRSSDAAGADAVIAADPGTDLFNPNAIRASLGTIFALGIASASSADVLTWLRARHVRIVAARVAAERLYTDVDLSGPVALAFGSEAHGLATAWAADDVVAVRLPMLGVADSLNVAATAAVMLYEARRQRGMPA